MKILSLLFLTCLLLAWTYGPLILSAGMHLRTSFKPKTIEKGVVPLVKTHSHNDYQQKVPVYHALGNGICSIEADVFLFADKLHIGHFFPGIHTIESLYLEPLFELINTSHGYVFPMSEQLGLCEQITLLVDMKTKPEPTWDKLEKILNSFEVERGVAMFQRYHKSTGNLKLHYGIKLNPFPPIKVVVSGVSEKEIPAFASYMTKCVIPKKCFRYATLDGRDPKSTDSNVVASLGWVSNRYTDVFSWPAPEDAELREQEIATIREYVSNVHRLKGGKVRVRFWATPEDPVLWQLLLDLNVDIIATDELDKLLAFMLDAK